MTTSALSAVVVDRLLQSLFGFDAAVARDCLAGCKLIAERGGSQRRSTIDAETPVDPATRHRSILKIGRGSIAKILDFV